MSDPASELLRLQRELFAPFNEGGSTMTLADNPQEKPIPLGVIDSYTVIRVQGAVFWVMFKCLGYDQGFQYTHTVKVMEWSQDNIWLLDLTDDRGQRFHIELLFPTQDRESLAGWRRWQAYKKRVGFERLDAELLADHIELANNWPAPS